MSLSRAIKARRAQLGLSQEAAAERVGMARTNWLRLEQRTQDPQLSTLVKIASALECVIEVDGRGRVSVRPSRLP